MCGIIGYCGEENSVSELVAGLKTLEYRGYDSAGISVFADDRTVTVKSAGRISCVEKKLAEEYPNLISHCGIGHTRWATHGKPDDINAHPHSSGKVSVVHNGIIENYALLRDEFSAFGYSFGSETDSETIAVIIDFEYSRTGDPIEAIRYAVSRLVGSYACAVMFGDRKDEIYAFRRDSPLIASETENGNYIASDFSAVSSFTDSYCVPAEGEILVMSSGGIRLFDRNNRETEKTMHRVMRSRTQTGKGDFSHFMIKEIFDTPEAVRVTCGEYIKKSLPSFEESGAQDILKNAERIYITACGTALNAGKIGKFFFESFAGIPTACDIASEFRYYPPLVGKNDAVIFITQSGETADTLASLRLMKSKGVRTIAIVNTPNSSAAREADSVVYTYAGTETAVASTKAYTVQTAVLCLMAASAGLLRGRMTENRARELARELTETVPAEIANILSDLDTVRELSRVFCSSKDCYFIGRGRDYFLAEESSLKLKEVSYIHSEAYAAGELKHGTIALIEEGTPVIAIASDDITYDKTVSNVKEVKSRGAKVLLVTCRETKADGSAFDGVYTAACKSSELFPICSAVFFQLIAYYAALNAGRDVDKPRNLAKSVTVE